MESSREPEDRYSSLYRIDPVIYLDRYLTENKHEVLSAYQQSDQWRKEMNQLQQQQRELKEIVVGETVYETQLLLDHTLKYLETISEQSEACLTTKTVLQTTRESMEQQIQALQEKEQITHQQCSRFLESSEMQKAGYTLHATLHRNEHRDVDETWAYVLVTTEDTTEDTSGNTAGNTAGNTFYPSEPTSCWFRFCDTLVEPVTLDTVLNESCRPHALFYVAQTCPTFSKRECLAAMPKDLKDFIHKDNIIFKEELETTTSWYKTGHGPMTSTLSEDGFSSMEASVDTAVGLTGHCQSSLNAKMELDMIEEHINAIVREAKEAPMSLLLNNVGIFLAHIGNMALLRHLVSFHWKMSSLPFNEKQARQDVSLQWIFSEYDAFVTIAQWVIVAFSWCGKDNTKALKAFVRAKILEENWKTHLLMDVESMDFPHLESLGFNPIVRQFGKALLLELNKAAYKKASEDRDRTKAMKEALWIASQAHKIMRPSKVSEEETCNALVEVWYGLFSSQSTVLLPDQQEILNDVITTYLDGQAGSDFETSEESMEQAGGGENNKMSLGEMYDEGYKIATFLLNIKL
ncbi:hypothetical protein BDF14DRAFT_1331569 [Spinellus fusiger]|nr:hypothetical protein BDF14DRAFT_1331569 [Spinellus fusiger]